MTENKIMTKDLETEIFSKIDSVIEKPIFKIEFFSYREHNKIGFAYRFVSEKTGVDEIGTADSLDDCYKEVIANLKERHK